jgi:hypothetical protein
VLAAVLIVAMCLTLDGCGGASNGGSGSEPAVAQVARAAYVTSQGPGFKISMTDSGDFGGESFSLNMNGAFDEGERRGSFSESVDGKTVTATMALPYVYVHTPGKRVDGKQWIRLNVEGYTQALGVGSSLNTSSDPSQWVDFLKAAGQASTVGTQTLRGVPTTHYHVLVDFDRFAAVVPSQLRTEAQQEAALLERISGQSTLPIDVWIDAGNRVRRYQVQVPLCYQGEHASETVDTEMYDFGTQSIPAPPASTEAAEVSKQVNSATSKALEQLHC